MTKACDDGVCRLKPKCFYAHACLLPKDKEDQPMTNRYGSGEEEVPPRETPKVGPTNCNVAMRRRGQTAVPRTCARCTLGPCPFYERSDASPDGYAETSRYGVQRVESGPPERMGYTSGPADLPVGKRPVQTSDEALREAFVIALGAAMKDQGLTFARVNVAPTCEYEDVITACQDHTNRVLAVLRTEDRTQWPRLEAESLARLRSDFDRLGILGAVHFPGEWIVP